MLRLPFSDTLPDAVRRTPIPGETSKTPKSYIDQYVRSFARRSKGYNTEKVAIYFSAGESWSAVVQLAHTGKSQVTFKRSKIEDSPRKDTEQTRLHSKSELARLREAIRDLVRDEEYDEEFGVPTAQAVVQLTEWLEEVNIAKKLPPRGSVSTAGTGDLRVEWTRGTKEVRLVVPDSGSKSSYLYYEDGDEYGTIKNITLSDLIEKLTWLLK